MSRQRPDHKPDDSQLAVIHARENAIRLVAPAGSGKTETLVRRVIERTGNEGVDPRRILMLTFDNNGKQAFSRLLRTFAPRQVLPRFQTFNSFGTAILKQYFPAELAPTIQKPDIDSLQRAIGPLPLLSWDETHRSTLDTFQAMKEQGYRPVDGDREIAIQWLRNRYLELPAAGSTLNLSGPSATASSPDTETDLQLNDVFDGYLRYEHDLRTRGRMDFQDQKLRPLMHVMRSPDIIARMRTLYDEVIVDEAQDISRLDALLIWSAIGEGTTLTLAGDDDQTIYEFRQASSVFLRDAGRHFDREFTTYQLSINYRSPEAILNPAQALIANNVERIEKGVTSARIEPGEVIVHAASTAQARIAHLVATVRDLNDRGFDWAEIGILVPQAWQCNTIRAALEHASVPTKINTGRNDTGGAIEQAVELSTVHKAKGRQWRAVFLPMSGEGEMPTLQAIRQGKLEAERRTYYVSMSRAADVLVVSYLRDEAVTDTIERSLSGEITGTSGASRFLFEAGLVMEEVDAEPVGDMTAPPEASTTTTSDDETTSAAPAASVAEVSPPENTDVAEQTEPTPERPSVADRLRQRDPESLRNLGRAASIPPAAQPQTPVEPAPAQPTTENGASASAPPKPSRSERAGRAERRQEHETSHRNTTIPASILQLVDAAERKHAEQDARYALFDGWDAVYQTLKLMLPGLAAAKGDAFELIGELEYGHVVTPEWARRLHEWRKTRNQGIKQGNYDRKGIADLIAGLRPFMAVAAALLESKPAADTQGVARTTSATPPPAPVMVTIPTTRQAPVQIYPVPTAQAYATARILANGGFDPERGTTIRTIGIHTLNHGVEFLPLQLGLILLDVKFFVPGTFRYLNSPIFARYCDRSPDVRLPSDLRRLVRQPSEVAPEVETRIHHLLDEMLDTVVAQEGYRGRPGALLDHRLRDAVRLANGEVNRGIRLEPLAASRGAGWSKS